MLAAPLRRIEGKYEIIAKLREGGMGAIYKVRHLLLDEIRVIKLMRPQLVEDQQLNSELRARFVREARVAIKLRHPNIAHLYDFTSDDDGTALIVMEFILGKTLEELLKTAGPPPLGLALEIAQQSLRALGYLHSKGFVHRDISPDNLMLTEDAEGNPQIKLIDLGIAKILGAAEAHLTQTGTFLGKVRYASPEQFGSEGAANAGAGSDLYSFGVVLYELLTGIYPIAGRDPNSIIAGHMFRPPIAFEETDRHGLVPLGLRSAVLKALAKKPEDRHASAQEFARVLARFRVPDDAPAKEWKKLLGEFGEVAVSPVEPGSTQDRLDEHFGPEATPAPTLPEARPTLRTPFDPLATTDAGSATRTQGEQRQAIDTAVRAVETALARDDLGAAEAKLCSAEVELGEQPVFQALHDELAARSRARLAAQVSRLVDSARRHAAAGELEAALSELKGALQLDPGRGDLAAEAAETEAALARQVAERQRRAAVALAADEVGALLAAGDLEQAAKLLARARADHPADSALEALDQRLMAMRAQALAAELAALLSEARQLAGEENWKEADKLLRRAERLAPEDAAVRQLQAEIVETSRRLEEERRRLAQIERQAVEIGKRLDRGELDKGAALLDRAAIELGEAAVWGGLRERLERLRHAARQAQVTSLLERARQEAAATDLAQAMASVREAAEIDRSRTDVQELSAELAATLAHEARQRRLAEELAETVATVREHLDRGELVEAGNLLDRVRDELRGDAAFEALGQRLVDLRSRALAAELAALLTEARKLAGEENWEGAGVLLRRAERLAPEDVAVRQLQAEIVEASRRAEEERRRLAQIERRAAEIGKRLDRGKLEESAALLDRAATELGEAAVWGSLHARLERLRDDARQAQVTSLLERARRQAAAMDLTDAVASVRQAAEIDRTRRDVQDLAAELEAALDRDAQQRRLAEELAEAVAAVRAHLDRGELDQAGNVLDHAVARFGAAPALGEQSERREQLRRRALAEQAGELLAMARRSVDSGDVAAGRESLRQARALAVDTPKLRKAAAEIEAAAARKEKARRRQEELAAAAGTVAAQVERDALDLERQAGVSPQVATARQRRPAAVAAGAALLVAALAATAWQLGHHGGREQAAGPSEGKAGAVGPGQAGPAALPPPVGTLFVDALPWGEVIEVRDAQGKTQPIPAAAYTPIVLSLAPGRYTIRIRNPAFPRPAMVAAEVPAGGGTQPVSTVAEFRVGDADEFLKGMGW